MSAIADAVEIVGGQQELAEKIGVTQSLVSQWVNGVVAIHNRHFQNICAATGGKVTPAKLLADEMARSKAKSSRRVSA